MKAYEVPLCEDCREPHLGRCGGLPFVARLRSVRLDPSVTETRTRKNYYDRESLDEMFGEDEPTRRERYWDETKGRGAVKLKDATPDDIDFFTGTDIEEDGDAPF